MSPTLLTLELLILAGKTHPKSRAWMFVIGAAVTIFAVGVVATTLLRNVATPDSQAPDPWLLGMKSAITLVLIIIGVRQLLPTKTVGERHRSRTQQRIASAKTPVFFIVGVVGMLTNVSTIVLYLPAIHLIVHASESESNKLLAATMLWLITIVPILLPVLAVSVVGQRSDAFLARVNAWTTRHTRQINAGLCFFFALLIGFSAATEYLG